jgi:hypothetical protein
MRWCWPDGPNRLLASMSVEPTLLGGLWRSRRQMADRSRANVNEAVMTKGMSYCPRLAGRRDRFCLPMATHWDRARSILSAYVGPWSRRRTMGAHRMAEEPKRAGRNSPPRRPISHSAATGGSGWCAARALGPTSLQAGSGAKHRDSPHQRTSVL